VPRMSTVAGVTVAIALLATPASAGAEAAANNRAEAQMTAAINQVRAQHGLGRLVRSSSLTGSAERYSHSLMANDTFGHAGRIQASGRFAMLGEALELHGGRRFDVRGALRRWMESPSHRAIVLSPTMQRQGAGVTRGRFGSRRSTIWVLHVGRIHPPGTTLPNVSLP
jgi:uncharacterized protein YkwD